LRPRRMLGAQSLAEAGAVFEAGRAAVAGSRSPAAGRAGVGSCRRGRRRGGG
jgi:hypothetical protein